MEKWKNKMIREKKQPYIPPSIKHTPLSRKILLSLKGEKTHITKKLRDKRVSFLIPKKSVY